MDAMGLTGAEKKSSYEEIKEYVLEHMGLNVSSLYIAQVKEKCGSPKVATYKTVSTNKLK